MRSRDPHQQTTVSDTSRGQAEVVAIVLLLGLIAIAAISVLVVGQSALSSTQEDAELEQVEQAFVQLGHAMASATADSEMSRTVDIDIGESGAITKTDAGNITIEGGGINETISVGAIEYEHEDGSIVAYQAGGVWSERGNETTMLAAPPIHYDFRSETLIMPITDMSEQRDLSSGSISLGVESTDPVRNITKVKDDSVDLTIESPYYIGWKDFFESRLGSGSIRSVDHDNERIEVRVGFHDLSDAVSSGTSVANEDGIQDHPGAGNVFEDPHPGSVFPEMDPVIEEIIEDAAAGNETLISEGSDGAETIDSGQGPHGNGTYYTEGIEGDETYEFDLSDGNVTFAVGGDIDLDEGGNISVVDRDEDEKNVLRIYSNGSRLTLNGDICIEGCDADNNDATAIQFYGPSTMAVDIGPGSGGTFHGLLYVASTEDHRDVWGLDEQGHCDKSHQLHYQAGDADFNGAFVGYSACAHSEGNYEFTHDENLADSDFEAYPDTYELPAQITFLNISLYELDVVNE